MTAPALRFRLTPLLALAPLVVVLIVIGIMLAPATAGYIGQNPYAVRLDGPGGSKSCTRSAVITATVKLAETGEPVRNQVVIWEFKSSPSSNDRIEPRETITRRDGTTKTTVTFALVSGKRIIRATIAQYPATISVRCTAPPPPTAPPPTPTPRPTRTPATPTPEPPPTDTPATPTPAPTIDPATVTPVPPTGAVPTATPTATQSPSSAPQPSPTPGAASPATPTLGAGSPPAVAVIVPPASPAGGSGAGATSGQAGDGGSMVVVALVGLGLAGAAALVFLMRRPRIGRNQAP